MNATDCPTIATVERLARFLGERYLTHAEHDPDATLPTSAAYRAMAKGLLGVLECVRINPMDPRTVKLYQDWTDAVAPMGLWFVIHKECGRYELDILGSDSLRVCVRCPALV